MKTTSTPAPVVVVDTERIVDWDSFHDVFVEIFGFPDFYGRNMDAWTDCMTYLDDPDAGMTAIHCAVGCVVTIHLNAAKELAKRCPHQFNALVECSAFVNFRRLELGEPAVIALSYAV